MNIWWIQRENIYPHISQNNFPERKQLKAIGWDHCSWSCHRLRSLDYLMQYCQRSSTRPLLCSGSFFNLLWKSQRLNSEPFQCSVFNHWVIRFWSSTISALNSGHAKFTESKGWTQSWNLKVFASLLIHLYYISNSSSDYHFTGVWHTICISTHFMWWPMWPWAYCWKLLFGIRIP